MFASKGFIIIAGAFAILYSRDCQACFRYDDTQSITIASGSSFYQECQCKESGHNTDELKWLDNNHQIITMGLGTHVRIFAENMGNSLNLHIPVISKTMSGIYKCVALIDGQEHIQAHNVHVYDSLYFYDAEENQHLVQGKDSRINCQARGDTEPMISWYKDEYTKIEDSDKYEVTPEGLIVKDVSPDDAGVYKCTASVTSTSEEVDRYIKVEIMTKPIIHDIRATPENTVVAGEYLTLECIADGIPHPEYSWKKLEQGEGEQSNSTYEQALNNITFTKVQPEDRGYYECQVENFAGIDTKAIFIEVLTAPVIEGFSNFTVIEGNVADITCNATGRSSPNVTIYFIGKNLNGIAERDDIPEIPNYSAPIMNRFLEGYYVCNATNEVDIATELIYITVLYRPYFTTDYEILWGWNGKSINLSCEHDSNPAATVHWRYQGNQIPSEEQIKINRQLNSMTKNYLTLNIDKDAYYGIYECSVANPYGEAKKTITIREGFVPSTINNVTIPEVTATSVIFNIDGPYEVNGPSIYGYTAEYDEASNYEVTNIHVNRTWAYGVPYKLEKLKPKTKYLVKFAALNEVGASMWSDTIGFQTLEKSVPESPIWEQESLQLTSNNQVLKWKAPMDNGAPINGYTLRYCPIDDEILEDLCKLEEFPPQTEIKLVNLNPNTTYYLELVAHNSEGNSNAANISLTMPAPVSEPLLSAGALIGISVVVVLVCLLLFDILFLAWRRQGIIASCCIRKSDKKKTNVLHTRDKKGLLRDNVESTDSTKRLNNGHKEFEYNKTTGIITGKHSSV